MAEGWRKIRTSTQLGPELGAPKHGDHTVGSSLSSPQSSQGDPVRTGRRVCPSWELESSHGTRDIWWLQAALSLMKGLTS